MPLLAFSVTSMAYFTSDRFTAFATSYFFCSLMNSWFQLGIYLSRNSLLEISPASLNCVAEPMNLVCVKSIPSQVMSDEPLKISALVCAMIGSALKQIRDKVISQLARFIINVFI